MIYRFHLSFYCPNKLSELLPGNLENAEVFLENLASRELQTFRHRAIMIVGARVNFDPAPNMSIFYFHIWCLYSLRVNPTGLGNIEVEVEAKLSTALLELFGGTLPLFVENIDG
jgi:hypothetical protein